MIIKISPPKSFNHDMAFHAVLSIYFFSPISGHGPYSHLWESFVKQARVQRAKDPSYQPEEVREQKLKPHLFFFLKKNNQLFTSTTTRTSPS